MTDPTEPEWCRATIWPSWANRWVPCGSAFNPTTGRCWQYHHPRPPEETTVTDPTGPNDPGAHDECATCGHRRWRHKQVDGQQVCTEYLDCACGGHFVELSYGTRMARFVESAQKLARTLSVAGDALADAMAAGTELYAAMQQAGLIPDDDTEAPTGKHAADLDRIAEALDIPREFLTGTPGVQHWSAFSPAQRMPAPGAGQRVRSQDDLTGPVRLDDTHCPDCSHPWSYHDGAARPVETAQQALDGGHTGAGCTMPVIPGTRMPVVHGQPSQRCGCTASPAAPTEVTPAAQDPSPSTPPATRDRAVLWSWDARSAGWVQIDQGAAQDMKQGRDRRYEAAANNDITGAAWLVLPPGGKPTGHPDLIGVPIT